MTLPRSLHHGLADCPIDDEARGWRDLARGHKPDLRWPSRFVQPEWSGMRPLAVEIDERAPLSAADLRRLGADLARVLHDAHRSGTVHGRLSPWLIGRCADGTLCVTDCGMHARVERLHKRLAHSEPEVDRDVCWTDPCAWGTVTPDPRCDLFSVGLILWAAAVGVNARCLQTRCADHKSSRVAFWALCGGHAPIHGLRKGEVSNAARPIPAVRYLRPDLADGFGDVIDACLAPDLDDRPASALELLQLVATFGHQQTRVATDARRRGGAPRDAAPVGVVLGQTRSVLVANIECRVDPPSGIMGPSTAATVVAEVDHPDLWRMHSEWEVADGAAYDAARQAATPFVTTLVDIFRRLRVAFEARARCDIANATVAVPVSFGLGGRFPVGLAVRAAGFSAWWVEHHSTLAVVGMTQCLPGALLERTGILMNAAGDAVSGAAFEVYDVDGTIHVEIKCEGAARGVVAMPALLTDLLRTTCMSESTLAAVAVSGVAAPAVPAPRAGGPGTCLYQQAPDDVWVREGALARARMLAGDLKDLVVLPATPGALGVRCGAEVHWLLPRGTTTPTRKSERLSHVSVPRVGGIVLELLESIPEGARIATLAMALIPTRPEMAGREVEVEVVLDVSAHAAVSIGVRLGDDPRPHHLEFPLGDDGPDAPERSAARCDREVTCWYDEAIRDAPPSSWQR